eukprot:Skav220208  [mRNA]  locus=scaffold2858:234473:235678:+ [translate_table: standard]
MGDGARIDNEVRQLQVQGHYWRQMWPEDGRYPDLAPGVVKQEVANEGTGVSTPSVPKEEKPEDSKVREKKKRKRDQGKEKRKAPKAKRSGKKERSPSREAAASSGARGAPRKRVKEESSQEDEEEESGDRIRREKAAPLRESERKPRPLPPPPRALGLLTRVREEPPAEEDVERRPGEYGLKTLGIRGSVGEHFSRREDERTGSGRVPEPDHPPRHHGHVERERQGERRRSRSRNKKSKGKKHRERGRERGFAARSWRRGYWR